MTLKKNDCVCILYMFVVYIRSIESLAIGLWFVPLAESFEAQERVFCEWVFETGSSDRKCVFT